MTGAIATTESDDLDVARAVLHTEAAGLRALLFLDEGFTAYYGLPLIAKEQVKGVLEVFQRGGPGYGQQVSAAELKQKLSLPQ